MYELALFAGAGGGCLASRLLGHRVVGYVENEPYAQEVLQARIADGCLDAAPIFGDIRAFVRYGWAERYRGRVDLVSGGFPCQDISNAGKRAGISGERSGLWKAMRDTVGLVRPRFVFIENVSALIARGLDVVLADLAALGFDATWDLFRASDVGAPHRRERVFILADAGYEPGSAEQRQQSDEWAEEFGASGASVADAKSLRHRPARLSKRARSTVAVPAVNGDPLVNSPQLGRREGRPESELWSGRQAATESGGPVADADAEGRSQPQGSFNEQRRRTRNSRSPVADAISPDLRHEPGRRNGQNRPDTAESRDAFEDVAQSLGAIWQGAQRSASPAGSIRRTRRESGGSLQVGAVGSAVAATWPPGPGDASGWQAYIRAGGPEPAIRRGADGLSRRIHRLRALGNAQVPVVAALAFLTLKSRLDGA